MNVKHIILAGFCLASTAQVANASSLFVSGSTFQVQASNSPDSFTQTVNLTPGNTLLDNGAVNLNLSIVSAGGGYEWLVFNYTTTNGGPLSSYNANWSINQVGLNAAVPVNFNAAYSQFSINGTAQTPSYSFFGGYSVESNPVPGESGVGLGASGFNAPLGSGPLVSLGAYINPWGSFLSGANIDPNLVNGYEQALEFGPTVSAVPLPASLPLMGAALIGLGGVGYGMRRKTKVRQLEV